MKKILAILMLLVTSTAMAQDKVVVIPLFGETTVGSVAPIPKSGATVISGYDLVSGEDGELKLGVVWPNPRFTDNGNGTITDRLTGLIWLQNANCPGVVRTWATALSDVDQLNTNGMMNANSCSDTSNSGINQTDWRLPNVRELYSLVDLSQVRPAIPTTHPFVDLQSEGNYWSSTTKVDEPILAWDVSMMNGNVSAKREKTVATISVWPVRGGN